EWQSLATSFASKGYHLYKYDAKRRRAYPPDAERNLDSEYPYARIVEDCSADKEARLEFPVSRGMRVWPARDSLGHEVMIRLVTKAGDPPDEWLIYKKLQEVFDDPRNHTLPAVAEAFYECCAFVVTPRWDTNAIGRTEIFYDNLAQILDMTEAFLEGLEFLHENRIAHCNIREENMVMNALTDMYQGYHHLRDRAEVQYAFIDFGSAIIFPEDTDLSQALIPRPVHASILDEGTTKQEMYNPFIEDVRLLMRVLQNHVRHVDCQVRGIESLFRNVLKPTSRPTASGTLASLRKIRKVYSESHLASSPKYLFWEPG
ncbi:hypothetical protein DFP72DRAFT_761132, partial [Ephemerocybe angulata]